MSLIEVVRDFFTQANLVHSRGIVAVSGGPDSVALAKLLVDLLGKGFFQGIVLGHVNHQLRDAESDADEQFVANLPLRWQQPDLPCRTCRLDVAAAAQKQGENLEKTARELRYDWLACLAQESAASWIATGHSADDQAETVLHRLLRGSGLQGLGGIAPRRPLIPLSVGSKGKEENIELVRPLLGVSRKEILAYLQSSGQTWCQDSSNQDLRFTRNRLRLELLPHLAKTYQPAIVDVLCRLANQARGFQAEIQPMALDLLQRTELPRADKILVFHPDHLANASTFLICEMFRSVWQRENWPLKDMDQTAWLRLVSLVQGQLKAHDFPGPIHARRLAHVLQIGPPRPIHPRG